MDRKLDENERQRLYNLPFRYLKGYVYCHLKGCIYSRGKNWVFRYRANNKRSSKTFNTLKEAKDYQEAWVSENPFVRCGTVYVQFGDELLCRGKSGTKWVRIYMDEQKQKRRTKKRKEFPVDLVDKANKVNKK